MTLQEIANYGEILAAAGVIASLIFVGWQIKANTKTARLKMHEQITQTLLSFLNAVLRDPDAFVAADLGVRRPRQFHGYRAGAVLRPGRCRGY